MGWMNWVASSSYHRHGKLGAYLSLLRGRTVMGDEDPATLSTSQHSLSTKTRTRRP